MVLWFRWNFFNDCCDGNEDQVTALEWGGFIHEVFMDVPREIIHQICHDWACHLVMFLI